MIEDDATIQLQRAVGRATISFRNRAGRTSLHRLFQEGCAKIRLPTPPAVGLLPEAILINTAGGLTGGDHLETSVTLERNSGAVITTQACERIYRSIGGQSVVTNKLTVENGSRLAWLPQETILFNNGRLARTLTVDLEGDAELVAVEAIIFGRTAMGERVERGALQDRWRIRRDGKLVHAEDFRLSGDLAGRLRSLPALGTSQAMATVLFAGAEPERFLETARAIVGGDGGASVWNGKFLARLTADTGLALRRRLEPLLSLVIEGLSLPKVWRI